MWRCYGQEMINIHLQQSTNKMLAQNIRTACEVLKFLLFYCYKIILARIQK